MQILLPTVVPGTGTAVKRTNKARIKIEGHQDTTGDAKRFDHKLWNDNSSARSILVTYAYHHHDC